MVPALALVWPPKDIERLDEQHMLNEIKWVWHVVSQVHNLEDHPTYKVVRKWGDIHKDGDSAAGLVTSSRSEQKQSAYDFPSLSA